MAVTTSSSENGGVLIISVGGEFDFSLLNEFRQAYSDEAVKLLDIVVDMRSASTIDSSALGMLLNMQQYLNKGDGEISLINCNSAVKRVLDITHFEKKFTIK